MNVITIVLDYMLYLLHACMHGCMHAVEVSECSSSLSRQSILSRQLHQSLGKP